MFLFFFIDVITKTINVIILPKLNHRLIKKIVEFSAGYTFTLSLIHLLRIYDVSITISLPTQAILPAIIVIIEMIFDNEDYSKYGRDL